MKNACGTQEWSVKTVNCITGYSHNYRYCYAKDTHSETECIGYLSGELKISIVCDDLHIGGLSHQ